MSKAVSKAKKTYTLTGGDVSENHHGMQKNGELHANGYSYETMRKVYHKLTAEGVTCEMDESHPHYDGPDQAEEAWLLVIRKGVQHVFSLSGWCRQIPTGRLRPRGTQDTIQIYYIYAYRAFTFYGQASQLVLLSCSSHIEVPQPRLNHFKRFRLYPFRSPLLRVSRT